MTCFLGFATDEILSIVMLEVEYPRLIDSSGFAGSMMHTPSSDLCSSSSMMSFEELFILAIEREPAEC
jgi:hypothetical protein